MREYKIQKTTGGVVHAGSWTGNESDPRTSKYGYFTPSCGSGVVYAMGTLRNIAGFRELKPETEVTCKKCVKLIEKVERLGLDLKVEKNEDGSSRVIDTREEKTEDAPEIKPGRCLQRVGKVGTNPTQCVKDHAHEDDHEDRFGNTYGNHLTVPTADPLSPTAQAVLDANRVWEAAMTDAWRSEGTDRQDEADAAYEAAEKALCEAREAHRKAREASRQQRDARQELARLEAPKGSNPVAQRLGRDHGLNFF